MTKEALLLSSEVRVAMSQSCTFLCVSQVFGHLIDVLEFLYQWSERGAVAEAVLDHMGGMLLAAFALFFVFNRGVFGWRVLAQRKRQSEKGETRGPPENAVRMHHYASINQLWPFSWQYCTVQYSTAL